MTSRKLRHVAQMSIFNHMFSHKKLKKLSSTSHASVEFNHKRLKKVISVEVKSSLKSSQKMGCIENQNIHNCYTSKLLQQKKLQHLRLWRKYGRTITLDAMLMQFWFSSFVEK